MGIFLLFLFFSGFASQRDGYNETFVVVLGCLVGDLQSPCKRILDPTVCTKNKAIKIKQTLDL